VTVDDFRVYSAASRAALAPRVGGLADASLSSGELLVQGSTRGGEAIVENFTDSDYMVQADVKLNSGANADLWVRYADPDNGYRVRLDSGGTAYLTVFSVGKATQLATGSFTVASPMAVKIKFSGAAEEERG